MNYTIGIIAGCLIAIVAIWIIVGSKKRKWYKVLVANNEILLLYRDINERLWRTSDRYMRFKNEQNKEITFPSNAHWVLMWEEIPMSEISLVREEINRRKVAVEE